MNRKSPADLAGLVKIALLLIDAAEQLKVSLRDTLGKTNELIVGLKRHRKEAKIVRTTLDSLRQLQPVG